MSSGPPVQGAHIRWINGGRRLHLQHGPIDLIVSVEGGPAAVQAAYGRAIDVFPAILPELASELEHLRTPIWSGGANRPQGQIARRMFDAARVYAGTHYITPMVAVAGSVADYVLAVILSGKPPARASVNNGGDIALYLHAGERFDIGVCDNVQTGSIVSTVTVRDSDEIGGIATSGWAGRSHSFGIADAVTVLAVDGASADCAATIIANAVNLPECPKIRRMPASELFPDSDLGDRLVTVGVDSLDLAEVKSALYQGRTVADRLLAKRLIKGAFISLNGETIVIDGQSFVVEGSNPISLTKVNS